MIVDTILSSRVQALRESSRASHSDGAQHVGSNVVPWRSDVKGRTPSTTHLAHDAVQSLIGASFEALDLLGIGVMVCAGSGRMLFANETADTVLITRDGIEVDSKGIIRATQACDPSLNEVIEQVARGSAERAGQGLDAAVAIRRASGKRALTLLVRPADGASQNQENEQAAVLLIMIDSALPVQIKDGELRRLFGLTLTESRLARLLMEGKDLDGCCDELGISRSTVRMHRRNLFSKTGVRRQTQLITLLFKSIGLGPRDR